MPRCSSTTARLGGMRTWWGGVNSGWSVMNYALYVGGRTAVSAVALGLAARAVEESVRWARERRAFGRALIDHQAAQFKLASMYQRLETMRTLVYYSAYLYDSRDPPYFLVMTHAAKLYSGPTAVEIARDAVQMHGGGTATVGRAPWRGYTGT